MPADHGLGLHDQQSRSPARPEPGKPDPEDAVPATNLRLLDRPLQDGQLVAERQILGGQVRRVTEEGPKQHRHDPKHAHRSAFPTPRNAGIVRGKSISAK